MEEIAARLRLQPDEQVVLDLLPSKWWTSPRYVFTLGLWAIWRKRHHFVLTNHRIVVVKGIVSKTEKAIPLDRVQDAAVKRSPLSGGYVYLSSAGGPALGVEKIGPLTQAEAAMFADALTPLIRRSPTAGSTP